MRLSLRARPEIADSRGVCAVLGVALLDAVLGEEVRLPALLSVGPVLASARAAPRAVIGTGVIAAVVGALAALNDDALGTRRAASGLITIALVTAFSAVAARRRTRQESRLAATSRVADAAQLAIAPSLPTAEGPVRLAASYESADAGARIGGDFCEVVPVRDGVRVLMGDVQGKGLGAAALSNALLGSFRDNAPTEAHLENVGLRMSCSMLRRPDEERFVTMTLAQLTDSGELTVLNYGHPSPLITLADGTGRWADPHRPGLPLGLAALADCEPGYYRCTLHAGDRVLFHTDGLTESRDEQNRFYPLDARAGLLRDADPATCLNRLRDDVRAHAAGAGGVDDSALLLVEYQGQPAARDRPATSTRTPMPTRALPLRHTPEQLGCHVCAVADCPLRHALDSGPAGEDGAQDPEQPRRSDTATGDGPGPAAQCGRVGRRSGPR
ncbi:serine phosphatase RsbU (regulator of sigma subunit) [Streptomyces sp. 840.1]|uniref:PP2C family protein-serine/threonine phosphatase n=1 Tax=Streptomyces sp. 840.1 TaxID=2485152 RepID=UPI000F4938AA|nr:PP2C family protein-serine/threonine phosphatase [Streptomyces sp. 840.1]ROQ69258.1 serine phosphatase RsbU (regulator of sigma subunit) [Streptomyces sp. 840.1]